MTPIEERLWNFIDGTCSADEKLAIEKLLQSDPAIKLLYEEFLSLSLQLKGMELEEPSMRFTQNVMDQVALQPMPKALQTKVDKRIINGIGGFFMVILSALIIFTLTQFNWSGGNAGFDFSMPEIDWTKYFGSYFLQGASIVFVTMGLFVLDRVLQYRRGMKALHS